MATWAALLYSVAVFKTPVRVRMGVTTLGQYRIMEQVLSAKAAVSTQRCCLGSSLRSCCLRVRNGSVLFCVFMLLAPFERGASVGFREPSDKKADTGKTALDCDFCNT